MITHETRREAHEAIKPKKESRKSLILGALSNMMQASANDIARALNHAGYIPYPDRNFVQPRLNELEKTGMVEVVGKKKDPFTGRTVAVYERRYR